MSDKVSDEDMRLLEMASNIVIAHLKMTAVPQEKLPELINETIQTLKKSINEKHANNANASRERTNTPAVPIEDSVHDDYIVCLEDGKKLKMLKRHLRVAFNMSVDEYFEKWGLPRNYPTVAPNYQEQRRYLARCNGFGYGIKKPPAFQYCSNKEDEALGCVLE